MKDDEARKVSINHCVRDSELAEMRATCDAADPGEWRVVGGVVTRYSGPPVSTPESLQLMAKSRGWLPRLLKGVEVLEEALRGAWASEASFRATLMRERDNFAADLDRAKRGETGPQSDLDVIVEAVQIGAVDARYLGVLLRRWARGESTQAGLYAVDIERERARVAEEKRIRAEVEETLKREREEIHALAAELRLTKKEREAISAKVKARVDAAMEGGAE
jgi:hypothetical protein